MQKPNGLENNSCPLGCKPADTVVLTGEDILNNLPGVFTVVKCGSCGLMRTSPRPTPETIGYYYPDDYGPYVGTVIQQKRVSSSKWYKKILRSVSHKVFQFNTMVLPDVLVGKMLEIGSASGSFLFEMKDKGWDVQGVEFSPKAAQAAINEGFKVHIGSLETAPLPKERIDLIVGWMVLEHLHDPVGSLRKLRGCAKKESWLVLSIPNAASLEFKLFADKWYALQLPTHLFHYTPKTLTRVLDAAGWKLERVYHQRTLNNLIGSFGYWLRESGYKRLGQICVDFPEKGGKWVYYLYPVAWFFSLFGQTGRMTIWARPKK